MQGDASDYPGYGVSEELWAFVEEKPYERRSILAFVRGVADSLPVGTLILDVGAGDAPYRELFAHCHYRSLDWEASVHGRSREVDLVSSADTLPMPDKSVDAVLCTQVLEHVPRPGWALCEMARVLRPGGGLYLTVPFVWELHELPHDYWRFTPASLKELTVAADFYDVQVTARTDFFTTMAQLMHNAGEAIGRAPDGRDGERVRAAELLTELGSRLAALAPLDVARTLPLGFTLQARRR